MAFAAWHVPVRLATGAFILDAGLKKRQADAETAKQLHGFASTAYPQVGVAAATVRDVARMQSAADSVGSRLLTFTIEAEVAFGAPGDIERFTTEVADLVAGAVARFDRPGGRRYRVVVGGHPAPRDDPDQGGTT